MKPNYHRWSPAEVKFLTNNYGTIGDTKLAELMNQRFPKAKHCWTKKHIEKKRKYLKLKRTKRQEHNLRCQNNKDGRHYRAWDTRGRAKDGTIKKWGVNLYIKVNGQWFDYYRNLVNAKPGEVARKTKNGVVKISRAEHGVMNRRLWMEYSPELKETVKVLNQLKKITNGKENPRLTRNAI